jgi:nucleoside-diphosphate-sugar epimerase
MRPNDGRVISNFVVQALQADITIYGDGSHARSFCYVDDLRGRSPHVVPLDLSARSISIRRVHDP